MNIALQEIFGCHEWGIELMSGQQLWNALLTAIANHADDETHKSAGYYLSKNKSFASKLFVGDVHRIEDRLYWNDEVLAEDDQIINVVVIEGAITRNGGACTYGSKEQRDQIMYANQIPQVVGHIFLINTPGGMVPAGPDYTMAIEDCRKYGKPTVALIDGICYSMGEYVACQCDYVIATNPEDGFGCIGTMCIGDLAPHGAINSVTQERMVILVGKGSPDKNIEAREAAAGNDALMQAEADKGTEAFHALVKASRPQVTDDLLTGKTFKASEVMGRLVDEIGGMDRAIEVIFELADGNLQPAREVKNTEHPDVPDNPANPGNPDQENALHTGSMLFLVPTGRKVNGVDEYKIINPQNNNEMTDEEKKAAEVAEQPAATQEQTPATEQPTEGASATEAPAVSEETTQEEQPAAQEGAPAAEPASQEAQENATTEIDKIQETLHTAEQKIAEKDAEIAQLKETLATLNGIAEERDQANATVADRDKTIETLTAEKDEKDKTIAEHVATITAKDAKIAEHVATIEKLNKQVKDLQGEVKELSEKPAPMVDEQAGIPQDNGTGEGPKKQERITSDMSYEEIQEFEKRKREKK